MQRKQILKARKNENNQKIGLLKQSLSDIAAIGNAKETYRLTEPSASDGTHKVVKDDDGVINIEGSSTALHIHEIRHVGQSIKAGGLRFWNNKLLNSGSTTQEKTDMEIDAYKTQFAFSDSDFEGIRFIKDINEDWLRSIKYTNGDYVYGFLRENDNE